MQAGFWHWIVPPSVVKPPWFLGLSKNHLFPLTDAAKHLHIWISCVFSCFGPQTMQSGRALGLAVRLLFLFTYCTSFFALILLPSLVTVRVFWEVAISPVAVAPAELAALMHHGIILDRCCYLCSVSKPIILTQIYVNTAVSWHRMRFTHAQGGS